MYVCERGCDWVLSLTKSNSANRQSEFFSADFALVVRWKCPPPPPRRVESARTDTPITMREALLLALLSTVAALRVGTGGLSRRAAIAGGAAVTLLPPPGFASSGSMAGKTVLIVRWPQVEPPSLHATSD